MAPKRKEKATEKVQGPAPGQKTSPGQTASDVPLCMKELPVGRSCDQPDAIVREFQRSAQPSASGQSTTEADGKLCKAAAAYIHEFLVEERSVTPGEKGVDKLNRDEQKLSGFKVHKLASFVHSVGFDKNELKKHVAVQITPSSREEVKYNAKLCADDPLLPDMLPAHEDIMTMTTIIGGHMNYVNRCYRYGIICNHTDHCCTETGCMNMGWLRQKDEEWANAIEQGSQTRVLSHRIRLQPDKIATIQNADNAKHGANLMEHSLQLIRRMVQYCLSEERTAGQVVEGSVVRRFLRSVGTRFDGEDARVFFQVALRIGKDITLTEEMGDFQALCELDGSRELEVSYLSKLATLPLTFSHLRVAFIKAQLTCHDRFVVKNVCTMIKTSTIESCRPGKPAYDRALGAETCMREVREVLGKALSHIAPAKKTEMLTRVDSQVVRLIAGLPLQKDLRVYQDIAHAAYKHLAELPEAREHLPPCPWKPSAGDPPAAPGQTSVLSKDASAPRAGDACAEQAKGGRDQKKKTTMAEYDSTGATLQAQLEDMGFAPGATLKAVRETEGVAVGTLMTVSSFSTKDGEAVLMCKGAGENEEYTIKAAACTTSFEIQKKGIQTETWQNAPAPGETLELPMMSEQKAFMMIAMHKLFAQFKESKAFSGTRIRKTPKLGVFATEALSKGEKLPCFASTSGIIEGDRKTLTNPAFIATERLFVVPARSFEREKRAKHSEPGASSAPGQIVERWYNPASAVRLIPGAEHNDANAKLTIVLVVVVVSSGNTATEKAVPIVAVELKKNVKSGDEIVCAKSASHYWEPKTKEASTAPRQVIIGNEAKRQKND